MTTEQFSFIELVHLMSALDLPGTQDPLQEATLTTITGYTEWIGTTSPQITIGWDWRMSSEDGVTRLYRCGEPGSNVMLLDQDGMDTGPANGKMLGRLVDATPWQETVLAYLVAS